MDSGKARQELPRSFKEGHVEVDRCPGIRPMQSGEAVAPMTRTTDRTAEERVSTRVVLGKRIFLDLNPNEAEHSEQTLKEKVTAMGGSVLTLRRFGEANSEASQLMRVKKLLREGRAIWLRSLVAERHTVNAQWIAQCCRTAHRAGVPWWIRVRLKDPSVVPPLLALKNMVYACLRKCTEADGASSYDLTSDAVNIHKLGPKDLDEQIRRRFESGQELDLAAKPLDKEWTIAAPTKFHQSRKT